ncbi:MAG: HEAT repeat domain-containing protein [Pyrinomonadaceae bacterium]
MALALANAAAGQDLSSLAQTVRGGSVEQKREALRIIRNLRTAEASRAALPALRDPIEAVRATAAASVVFLPADEAHAALVPLLSDKSAFVRKEAAYAIGAAAELSDREIGDDGEDRVASALRTVLQRDKDAEVRAAAAVAMGQAGGIKSVWYLYFYLQGSRRDEANDFIRRSAVRSIGSLAESIRRGDKIVIVDPARSRDGQTLAKADLGRDVRAFGTASRLLQQILQDASESDDVRREAAWSLGNIGDRTAERALAANLNARDPYLASNCRDALQKLKLVE